MPGTTPCVSSRVQAAAQAFFSSPAATPTETRSSVVRSSCPLATTHAACQSAVAYAAGGKGFDSALTCVCPISVEVKV